MFQTRSCFFVLSTWLLGSCLAACAGCATLHQRDGAVADAGAPPDAAPAPERDASPTPDAPSEPAISLPSETCFTFATGALTDLSTRTCLEQHADVHSTSGGSFVGVFVVGDVVFCAQPGTYDALNAVPRVEPAACGPDTLDWRGVDAAGRGFFVTTHDGTVTRHYRMRVIDNRAPTLTFSYESVD